MSERMSGGGESLHDKLARMSGEELQDAYDEALDDVQVWNEVMRRMGMNPDTVDDDAFSDEQRRRAVEIAAEVAAGGTPSGSRAPESGVPTRGADGGRPDYGRRFGERGGEGGHENPDRGRWFGAKMLVVGMALGLTLAAGAAGVAAAIVGNKNDSSSSGDMTPGGDDDGNKNENDNVVQFGSTETGNDAEKESGYEKILGNYDYYNVDNKETDVAWMNAGDFITDLINDGKIKVSTNEEGKLVFENPSDANKIILKEAFKMNNEQAATFIAYARDAGLFGDYVPENVTIEEAEVFLETASPEQVDSIIKEWESEVDQATFEEVTETGTMNNEFIANIGGGDKIMDSSQAEAVYCETDETGHVWTKTTFANGGSIENKYNLSQFEMEDETYSAENDNEVVSAPLMRKVSGSFKMINYKPCVQNGSKKIKHPPEKKKTPPPKKKTPPPNENKKKNDPGRTGMSTGLEGSYVDQRGQNSELGTKPDETKKVNWDAGGGDGTNGVEQDGKGTLPGGESQVGGQDIKKKSSDGSGRTGEQVLKDHEQKGGADGQETGKQESRTEEDQKKKEEEAKLKKKAEEANEDYKELEQEGKANAQKSQEDLAKDFFEGEN